MTKIDDAHRSAAMDALYFSRHDEPVAHAIAAAEHRVRAAVVADLRGLLASAHTLDEVSVSVEYVRADSIELLIETYEAQQ